VRALPAAVDEELLFLYFENKRRSGGGPLVSVEKSGDRAVLVFEEAEGELKTEDFCSGGGGRIFLQICAGIFVDLINFDQKKLSYSHTHFF